MCLVEYFHKLQSLTLQTYFLTLVRCFDESEQKGIKPLLFKDSMASISRYFVSILLMFLNRYLLNSKCYLLFVLVMMRMTGN